MVNVDTEVHPELINSHFAYVFVSRTSHDAQIYTNNDTSLAGALSRDVARASVLAHGKMQRNSR